MNKTITPEQMRQLHALLNELNQMEYKPNIVASFTNRRTASSKELYATEADAVIKHLNEELRKKKEKQKPTFTASDKEAYAEKCCNMRNAIIAVAHNLGWEISEGERKKVDMQRLNAWLEKYAGGELNKLSAAKLQDALTQIQLFYKKSFAK